MEHTVAQAIRTVGAQICRRLDVLIDAAGKPPVKDIEGTIASRKPLTAGAIAALASVGYNHITSHPTTPQFQEIQTARKRGRPPNKKPDAPDVATPVSIAATTPDTAEVNHFSFVCCS
jgi:hypothetical protein